MKVCMCNDFDCASAREAIEREKPEKPEDVHRIVKGKDPNCGTCLSLIQAMQDRYEKDGVVPHPLKLDRTEIAEASRKLGERFTAEEQDQKEAPSYKRLYIVQHRKSHTPA